MYYLIFKLYSNISNRFHTPFDTFLNLLIIIKPILYLIENNETKSQSNAKKTNDIFFYFLKEK